MTDLQNKINRLCWELTVPMLEHRAHFFSQAIHDEYFAIRELASHGARACSIHVSGRAPLSGGRVINFRCIGAHQRRADLDRTAHDQHAPIIERHCGVLHAGLLHGRYRGECTAGRVVDLRAGIGRRPGTRISAGEQHPPVGHCARLVIHARGAHGAGGQRSLGRDAGEGQQRRQRGADERAQRWLRYELRTQEGQGCLQEVWGMFAITT